VFCPRALHHGQVGHRRLPRRKGAVDQERLVALGIQAPPTQERRLLCGSAQIQP
jgi:hypothetical protein